MLNNRFKYSIKQQKSFTVERHWWSVFNKLYLSRYFIVTHFMNSLQANCSPTPKEPFSGSLMLLLMPVHQRPDAPMCAGSSSVNTRSCTGSVVHKKNINQPKAMLVKEIGFDTLFYSTCFEFLKTWLWSVSETTRMTFLHFSLLLCIECLLQS